MVYYINSYDDNINLSTDNLVIGFFDGLHIGHAKLFKNLKGNTTILTFNFLKKNQKPIYSLQERIKEISQTYHPNNVIILDLQKINMNAITFIENFLKKWNFNQIIVGDDFKFGNDQQDVNFLNQFFNVNIITRNDNVSTTNIKKMIEQDDIESANQCLLQPYYYTSTVVEGQMLGRKLGFRTANFIYNTTKITPSDGVYITKAELNNISYQAVTFIGVPKTIAGITSKQFETHLIDYDGPEFYGQELKVIFYKKIGNVKKYPNLDALVLGIKQQILAAKSYFKDNKNNFLSKKSK